MRIASAWVLVMLTACGGDNTESKITAPGVEPTTKTKALEAGAALLQDRPPIDALNAYLDGFHFYNGNPKMQTEAHHYCAILNEEVRQCAIYDGNGKDAKLVGVEYIISERLFRQLPEAEKALWHSHAHEVKSGLLIAPGIPETVEKEVMRQLVGTYGKTWHIWHTEMNQDLPLGVPQLMMGFTADGQIDPALVEQRDKRFGVSTAEKRNHRADIPAPPVAPGADAWERGNTVQIADPTTKQAPRQTPTSPVAGKPAPH